MTRLYKLNKRDDSTRCPICGRGLRLLQNFAESNVAFFICFPCEFVGQVGAGPVTHRKTIAKLRKDATP